MTFVYPDWRKGEQGEVLGLDESDAGLVWCGRPELYVKADVSR